MNPDQLGLAKPAAEPADWSRIPRSLLRRPQAEHSQSAYCAPLENFTAPNRDYAYEGLTAFVGNENWKFLDALLFAPADPALSFRPLRARFHPWKSEYAFALGLDEKTVLHAGYYLLEKAAFPTLEVSFRLVEGRLPNDELLVRPLADLRPVGGPSQPGDHFFSFKERQLRLHRHRAPATLALTANKMRFTEDTRTVSWAYKLGSGEREGSTGIPRFVPETRALYSPGLCTLPLKRSASLQVSCLPADVNTRHELAGADEKRELARIRLHLIRFSPLLQKASKRWGPAMAAALASRSYALLEKFSLSSGQPDAGAYWFRQAWARDAFEALLVNFDPFYAAKPRALKSLLASVWKLQRRGFLPRLLGDPASGNSIDGTLLAFLASFELLERDDSPGLRNLVLASVGRFLDALKTQDHLDQATSLLKTAADASWTDSRLPRQIRGQVLRMPARIPEAWLADVAQAVPSGELAAFFDQPHYYLPEVNALWLCMLEALQAFAPSEETRQLRANAAFQFKGLFFGKAPAKGMADEQFRTSAEEVAGPLQAAALLPGLFTDAEIRQLLAEAAPALLYRDKKLFGVLVKKGVRQPFYNDLQYHAQVAWPKTNPYLLQLLMRAGETEKAEQLLLGMLDHQQNEGAAFYAQELFSPENGGTPVKNPAQLFSQYVQPYFDFLEG